MADVRRTIELVFGAVDQTSGVLRNMESGVGNFADRLESATAPIAGFTKRLLTIEGAALTVAAALGGVAILKAAEFQSATLELSRVLGEGEGNLEDFQKAAIDLSDQFGISASNVLSSTAQFRQAGFTAEEALTLVEQSIIAVKTTELDAEGATTAFIRLLAGFEAPASEAARALDIVNNVSANFATDVPKLTEAMARAAPVASTLGFSMEELASFLTPVISVFQSGELAGRAFSTTMQRLVSDNGNVVAGLDTLGVSQTNANGTLRSGIDILRDVQLGFQGLDDSQQVVIATQLAGVDQATKMVQVFKNLEITTGVLEAATNAQGATQKELDLAMQSTSLQADRAREAFNNAAIAIGERLRPEFTNLLQSLGDLGISIRQAVDDGNFDALFKIVNDGFISLREAAQDFAENLPAALKQVDFQPLIDALNELTGLADGAFDFDPSKPEDLARLIQLAVDSLTSLINVTNGVVVGLTPLFQGFSTLLDIFTSLSPETQKFIGLFLGLSTTLNTVVPLLSAAAGGFGLLSTALSSGTGLVTLVGGLAANLKTVGTLLIGNAGLVGLVGGASFGIASWAAEQTGLNDFLGQFTRRLAESNAGLPELRRELEAAQKRSAEHRAELERLTNEQERFNPNLRENIGLFEEWNIIAQEMGGTLKITSDGLAEVVFETDRTNQTLTQALSPIERAREELAKIGEQSAELADKGFALVAKEGTELGGVFTNITPEASALIKETKDLTQTEEEAAEAAAKLARESRELELEFAKLAAGEREVLLTVAGDIRVAEIQAQAEQVVAAFDSIGETVSSTTDLIGDLSGLLASADSQLARSKIEKILERELEIQEEALEAQKELIDAQVDFLRESARRLAAGDAQIEINADGLEPEIEAFMFKILEKIRIRANSQGQSFLLGIPTVT